MLELADSVEIAQSEIAVFKKVLRNICRIVIIHEKEKHEDGRDFFSKEQWRGFYNKVRGEKFAKERNAIEKGRKFVTAYNSPMGKAIDEYLLQNVQNGYESIFKCEANKESLFEMSIYRIACAVWLERLQGYKANIERVRKIIYKEN